MKKIKLTQNKYALVDDKDFDYLNQFNWCLGSRGYACSRFPKDRHTILMHRILLEIPKGMVADHINGNKLDNRRENLRVASRAENMANSKVGLHNKSGYKGVYLVSSRANMPNSKKIWKSQIMKNYKHIYLGYFSTKEEAALAYNRKASELFGNFAKLNAI